MSGKGLLKVGLFYFSLLQPYDALGGQGFSVPTKNFPELADLQKRYEVYGLPDIIFIHKDDSS